MNLSLSPELEQLVESKLKSGHYTSANEVINEALRLLQLQDELRDQIALGFEQAQRGELLDGEEVLSSLRRRIEAKS